MKTFLFSPTLTLLHKMARKGSNIERELRKIEAEERSIAKEEKRIESEEERIEQKEDLLRVFEELGLMRWKSYYVLTAGAILLLSLTFVTALWVVHDQVADVQIQIANLESKLTAPPAMQDWCPAGQNTTIDMGSQGSSTIQIIGKEQHKGKAMCHLVITVTGKDGIQTMDTWFDQLGNIDRAAR